MTVPAGKGAAGSEELQGYEAVRLFADRAAAVLPGFALDADSAPAVAGICRALDGIPLGIELAAARLRSLSPTQILSRLDHRFQLLSGGGPADLPHHRTLEAALEWSYELLTDAEQAMWRRVSVFAGSFDLDAAESVCAVGRVATGQTADLIHALVAKSILLRSGHGKARYRLLDTIGEFGLCKLRGRGNERKLRRRHRCWYAALAARQEAFGSRRAEWIATLDIDHENLRTALEFCLSEPGEVAAGAEMACDLWRYWETHGHLTEGRRILAALLEKLDEAAAVRPRTLWVAGFLALVQGDLPHACRLLEAGLAAAEAAGDVRSMAYASSQLGYVRCYRGEVARSRALAEKSLLLAQRSADQTGVVLAQTQIGFIHLCSGESQAAADRFGECTQLAKSSGNIWYADHARWGLAVATWLLGDADRAVSLICDSLRGVRVIDDPIGVAVRLDALAWISASRRQMGRAQTLLAAAGAAWAAIPALPPASLHRYREAALAIVRETLPEKEQRAASANGAAMSQVEAIAYALGESPGPISRSAVRAVEDQPQLTCREQDVAVLVTQGLSNSQIAAELVISVRTVETHVEHIMDKLGFSCRAQIAAWSAARPPALSPLRLGTPGR